MACFDPIQGFEKKGLTLNGKFGFTRSPDFARRVDGKLVNRTVPCRKCEGCRNDYSKEWAVKICHEASMNFVDNSFRNSFITLTYNDDFIPLFGSLHYPDFTNFMKRFRKAIAPATVRFYMIGEYGSINLRPHYHAIIFGYDFPDKFFHMSRNGVILYRSPLLESLWSVPRGEEGAGQSLGYSSIGDVTFASAAYVARYSMKKVIGSDATGRYDRVNIFDGEVIEVSPERAFMSNRPGIGKSWFDAYAMSDMYVKQDIDCYKDSTHMANGSIVRPPKYYDKLLQRVNPEMLDAIKSLRQDHMLAHADQFTPDILRQRRECFLGKLKLMKRQSGDIYVT